MYYDNEYIVRLGADEATVDGLQEVDSTENADPSNDAAGGAADAGTDVVAAGGAETTDTEVVAVTTGPADVPSDDTDFKNHFANTVDYAVNYKNRDKCKVGSIVQSKVKDIVKSWKIIGRTGKSTCILQRMNNITRFHGKYKITNPPGNPETMDIGFLKFMFSAEEQQKSENETEARINKGRWFSDELVTNPYFV